MIINPLKTGNTKLYLDKGDFLIAASSNAKADSVTISTSNAEIKVSGVAAVSYTNGNTKAQFLYGDGEVNGTKVDQYMEANIDNSNKVSIKNIEVNESLTNTINEISSMPYVKTMVADISNVADVKNYYKNENQASSETNTVAEITSETYTETNTNENITTFIITNEIKQ